MKRIGFIGYGLRSETMMKSFRSLEADITVAAVADPRHAEIAPGLAGDPYFAHTRWYADADELLAGEALDGVFIGTRCSLHTPYACRVLDMGLPLFLKKPVCITRPQYEQLRAAAGKEKQVVVSFRAAPFLHHIGDEAHCGQRRAGQAYDGAGRQQCPPTAAFIITAGTATRPRPAACSCKRPPMISTTSTSSQASAPFPCALRPPSCISKGTVRRACTVRIARITAPAPKAATW